MRVLMTADGVGGVFGYAVELARELSQRNLAVTLAVMGEPLREDQRAALLGIRGLELEERKCALEWMDDPWREVDAAGEWLLALTKRTRPSLVHLNGYCHALLDFGVPKLVVAHSCVRGWWRAVHGEPAPLRYAEYTRRVRAGLLNADLVVAPSQAMLRTLEEEYGHASGQVIANGLRSAAYSPGEKQPYFAAAGRFWDPAKNLALVVSAGAALPFPVRVAGPGSESMTAVPGVEPLGPLTQENLARLLAHASGFLHPARYEPFGLAVLEAALSGCALVLGDIPTLREIWGTAALYVPTNDPDGLAWAGSRLARDAALRSHLGAAARKRAERFSARAMAARYLTAYRTLVQRAARRAKKTALVALHRSEQGIALAERNGSLEKPAIGRNGSLDHLVLGERTRDDVPSAGEGAFDVGSSRVVPRT